MAEVADIRMSDPVGFRVAMLSRRYDLLMHRFLDITMLRESSNAIKLVRHFSCATGRLSLLFRQKGLGVWTFPSC
jgi:hypothetical protein